MTGAPFATAGPEFVDLVRPVRPFSPQERIRAGVLFCRGPDQPTRRSSCVRRIPVRKTALSGRIQAEPVHGGPWLGYASCSTPGGRGLSRWRRAACVWPSQKRARRSLALCTALAGRRLPCTTSIPRAQAGAGRASRTCTWISLCTAQSAAGRAASGFLENDVADSAQGPPVGTLALGRRRARTEAVAVSALQRDSNVSRNRPRVLSISDAGYLCTISSPSKRTD